jgi:hypothetical protein
MEPTAGSGLTPGAIASRHGPFGLAGGSTIRRRRPPDPEWVRFRVQVIEGLDRDGAFYYITPDRVAGRCPICSEPLGVRFKGRTPAADFVCQGGCEERDIVAMLGKART